MSELSDMSKPHDDGFPISKINKLLHEIVDYIVELNKFQYYKGQMSFYEDEYGFHRLIDTDDEWAEISAFLDDDIIANFMPKDIKTLLDMLRLDQRLRRECDFNPHLKLINTKNGAVNVITHELYPHNSRFEFTSCVNAEYCDGVTIDDAPTFKRFCKTSLNGDPANEKLLLQIIGYICSSYTGAKKAFLFVGEKNSGKSKILEFIQWLLGIANVCNIPLHKLGNRFNIAQLSRHKVNIQAELSLEPLREIETFKNAVGGDWLCGEDKGKPLFHFKNMCKFIFAGNGVPVLKSQDTTQAFISRLIFLIFPKEIPEDERDTELLDKLYEERDIIFSLAVNELRELIENNFKFEVPELSAKYLQGYSEQNNSINEFLGELCIFGTDYKVFSRDLYDAYKKFCADNCFFAHSEFAFLNAVASHENILRERITMDGKRLRGFVGIGLKKSI